MKETKLCTSCYNKRFYTVLIGLRGAEDFGGDGFISMPRIQAVACTKCNKNNKRRIKGIQKYVNENL